ncbi:MAG: imidazole glycerol phosphate synthase subunit HisH [Lachnospiraceae bacterium]
MIAVIDYGIGNLGSIENMLKKAGGEEVIYASCAEDLRKADKLILPGVGSFDMGMCMLNMSGMREELDVQVLKKGKPILGICLGMQMLGQSSEEGTCKGLGYIPFECKKFSVEKQNLRVPHMGWDYVEIQKECRLLKAPIDNLRFYFVHSYYAVCECDQDVMMTCDYGGPFVAAVNRNNVYGTQFHPEKSHGYGKWLFKNFVEEV